MWWNDFVGNHGKIAMMLACLLVLTVVIPAFAETDSQNEVLVNCTWAEYNQMTEEQQNGFYNSFADPEDFDDWMYYAYTASLNELPYPDKAPSEYTMDEYELLNEVQQELFFESFESAEAFDAWWTVVYQKPVVYFCTYAEFAAMDEMQQDEYIALFDDESIFSLWLDNAIVNAAEYEGKQLYEYSLREAEQMDLESQAAFFAAFADEAATNSWVAFEQWKLMQTDFICACSWAEFMAMNDVEKDEYFALFTSEEQFEDWAIKAQILNLKKHYEYTWTEYEALNADQKNGFMELFANEEAFENWMLVARMIGEKAYYELSWAEFEAMDDEHQKAFIGMFGNDVAFEKWMQDVR